MPSEEKHEGLVLRSIDFRDRQKILTLFTPTMGIVSLIVKGINRKKSHLLTLTSPFTCGEYLFRVSRSTLYTFRDGTPLKTHNELRDNLDHIEAATLLVKALLTSQLPEKPAPDLYALTLTYLGLLSTVENPAAITSSFLLKLLKHEGLLSLDHPPLGFSADQWQTVRTLADLRTIQTLRDTLPSQDLSNKIETLFHRQYDTSPQVTY